MGDLSRDGRAPEGSDEEIQCLNDAWNARIQGERPRVRDPELSAMIERLHASATVPPPRGAFVTDLKERLMTSTSIPFDHSGLSPTTLPTIRAAATAWTPPQSAPRRRSGWLGRGAFATAALLLVTLFASYSAVFRSGGDGPGPSAIPAFAPPIGGGTPSPRTGRPLPSADDPYAIVFPVRDFIAADDIDSSMFAPEMFGAPGTHVQTELWTVEPGADAVGPATDIAPKLIFDAVLDGAYTATFDGSAIIGRAPQPEGGGLERPVPGKVVELGRGDSVIYAAGTLKSLVNPRTTMGLKFERAVFYGGDAAPVPSAGAGAAVRVNGGGPLPRPLNNYSSVRWDYISIVAGYPLPETNSGFDRIVGPIGSADTRFEGYVLLVGNF